jgi:hypothetical protein
MNNKLFPITFSIPEEKISNEISKKTKLLSSLIPGKLETYIYNNEEDYYNEYKKSLFAMTTKKGGWDCMRHYEILANNCIPYFPNIEECPPNTMALFDKEMFIEGNKLYYKYKDRDINDLNLNELNECYELIKKWLKFTKDNLTTTKIAEYILKKTNYINVSKILYLSKELGPDYLRCITLHGFKTLFKDKCHDYPKIPHLYKSCDIPNEKLYGKGITYSKLLNDDLHDDNLDNTIEDNIKNHYYDIVIYGSYHRGMPLYDLIQKYYNNNQIILLCGEDLHDCDYNKYTSKGHYVFVREQ